MPNPTAPGLDAGAYAAFRLGLSRAMEAAGISQSELARRAGSTSAMVCQVLGGHRPGVSIDYADRLAAVLGMRVEQVIRRGRRLET